MFANNYWKSKELYKSISDTIPGFENLQPGQSISINDENDNLSYKVVAKPLPTRDEYLDQVVSGIVMGKPDSRMTMATREIAKAGLQFFRFLVLEGLKAMDIDLEADQRHDFDLYLQDVRTGENHWFRANHKQGKLEGLVSFLVDFDKEGNVIGNSISLEDWGISRNDPEDVIRSEGFKNNFTSLRQNIKG